MRVRRSTSVRITPYDWLAEAALVALTVVTALSMARLFTDSSFLDEVLVLAAGSHLLMAATRLLRLRAAVATLVWAAALLGAVTVLFYADTTWRLLPTGDTVDAANRHLQQAWDAVNASPPPVEPVTGLVLCAGVALALCAYLAETVAFGRGPMIVALLPASAVYGFTIVVGRSGADDAEGAADTAAGEATGAVLGDLSSAVLFCLAAASSIYFAWLRERRTDAWVEPRPGRGAFAMARGGVAMLSLAAVAAAVAGPRLPEEQPWIDLANLEFTEAAPWTDISSPDPEPWIDFTSTGGAGRLDDSESVELSGPRILVSPMVQIRSRLTTVSDRELFTVEVQNLPQYWRLTALDEFNGDEWRASASYDQAEGALPESSDPTMERASLIQTVTLTGLGNSYLPVAYEARRVLHDGGIAMEYEAATSSLIKSRSAALQGPNRIAYAVESAVPVIESPDRLRNADAATLNHEFLARNTQLPESTREVVHAEALRVTRDGVSDYHRALLLQDYFRRSGGFSYDLDVASRGGVESLEDFLFGGRAGYCQQFASAYTAMARSIGLPTRVAVGFTWGEWDPDRGRQGAYVVRGEHSHAWPEVYFAGTGWVRFEPTPGRGNPGDLPVTGYAAEQSVSHASEASSAGARTAAPLPSPPGVDGARSGFAGSFATADAGDAPDEPAEADPSEASAESSDSDDPLRRLLPAVLAAAVGALLLGLAPLLRRLRRQRVRAGLADDPAGLIEESWNDTVEALALARICARPTETPLELARRAAPELPAGEPMRELAVLTTHGRYGPGASQAMAQRADTAGSAVIAACRGRASRWQLLKASLNPATVLRSGRPRTRTPRTRPQA
ncbi:MAG: transglutaminaseTgpA domain-containing protein [Acidimicrobiaceae bacterium]|nr:transglutaminaseTgpA domain-containing protein [Acidimicrobiaceae bacterium]